jgi:hypothetical protein
MAELVMDMGWLGERVHGALLVLVEPWEPVGLVAHLSVAHQAVVGGKEVRRVSNKRSRVGF